jgi:hypothetical protein
MVELLQIRQVAELSEMVYENRNKEWKNRLRVTTKVCKLR